MCKRDLLAECASIRPSAPFPTGSPRADKTSQILHFDCGYGPLKFSDFRIGQQPIERFKGVKIEIREGRPDDAPLTLVPNTPITDAYERRIRADEGAVIIETREIQKGIINFSFPALGRYTDEGNEADASVTISIN